MNDKKFISKKEKEKEIEEIFSSEGIKTYAPENITTQVEQNFKVIEAKDIEKIRKIMIYALTNNLKEMSTLFISDSIFFSSIQLEIINRYKLLEYFQSETIQFHMNYNKKLIGENSILLTHKHAFILIEMMMGQKITELSDFNLNSLLEGVSNLILAINKNISNKLNVDIGMAESQVNFREKASQIDCPKKNEFIYFSYILNDNHLAGVQIGQIISISVIKQLLSLIDKNIRSDNLSELVSDKSTININKKAPLVSSSNLVHPIQYQELLQSKSSNILANYSISLLLDISMQLTVELGQAKMPLKKVLSLGEGSIIELDKLAGEPVDLLVNSHLIAKGEVVVIDENFGVRITEIVSPHERLENLISD